MTIAIITIPVLHLLCNLHSFLHKYVIMGLEKYASIRESELDMAVKEARADYEAGRTITESVDDHMKRVIDEI